MLGVNMIIDHLGKEYKSIEEMCKAYHIHPSTYKFRISSGMNIEKALTAPINANTCVDHLGNTFQSERKMCQFYNVNIATYRTRINNGLSVKDALTLEIRKHSDKGNICYDHLGNEYRSYNAMAKAYKIAPSVLRDRIKRGLSIEEALCKKEVRDHLGNIYKSERDMCRNYNISVSSYKNRIDNGLSIKDALTKPPSNAKELFGKDCIDHLGNVYKSQREMCQAYNLDYGTFRHRVNTGMSIQEALSHNEFIDHTGKVFRSELEMCKAHHIDNSTYRYRRREGFSIEEALTIPKQYSLGEYRISKILEQFCTSGNISSYLHNIQIKRLFEILSLTDKYNDFMDAYEKELNKYNINISRRKLSKFRFDFSIIKNNELFAFIEYDGIQHFRFVDLFFKTFEDFLIGISRDKSKNAFSEINNIPLLRIRYDQIDEKTVTYMINDLLNNPQKYIYQHNTYLKDDEYMSVFNNSNIDYVPFEM